MDNSLRKSEQLRGKRKYDVIMIACLTLCTLLWRWKAEYGFAFADESFYLTIPYRMVQGDSLLVHEWHLSQLAGLLLYPAMKLYLTLAQSTDGILLAFRYIYIASLTLAAAYIYLRLRAISPGGALCVCLVFDLYAPLGIMALSYNSLGILLLLSAGVTMATSSKPLPDAPLSGVMFAGAVLCCPFLLAVYVLYSALVLLASVIRRDTGKRLCTASPKYWLLFTFGAALLAAALFLSVAMRGGLSRMLAALPEILNDPEHASSGTGNGLTAYWHAIVSFCPYAPAFLLCIIALTALIAIVKPKRGSFPFIYYGCILAALLLAGAYMYYSLHYFSRIENYINVLMPPICIAGGIAYMLTENRSRPVFIFVFLPGVLYSFCINLGSNLGYYSISSALSVSAAASVFFMYELSRELMSATSGLKAFPGRAAAVLLALAVTAQIGLQCYIRGTNVFWEPSYSELTYTCEDGPQRGLRTSEANGAAYAAEYERTRQIRDTSYGCVLYFCAEPWLYLADDAGSASYSAWLAAVDTLANAEREARYWEINPEKLPDAIYIQKGFGDTAKYLGVFESLGLQLSETDYAYIFTR